MDSIQLPIDFMDEHILRANHAYAMVYLCAYRYYSQKQPVPTPAQIGKILGLKTSDVKDAIRFWEEEGFHIFQQLQPQASRPKTFAASKEIANFAQDDEALRCLYQEAQRMLDKVLSTSDIRTLFWIYDYLGLPTPVILMILNYAKQQGKEKMCYIEKIATDWADREINTVPKAEQHLAQLERIRSYEYHVQQLLGITSRPLTPGEREVVHTWERETKPSDELLTAAYEICIERKNKLSIKYMSGILKSWAEKGITTVEQVRAERSALPQKPVVKSTAFSNFTPRGDIDYKQLELDALNRRIHKAKQGV